MLCSTLFDYLITGNQSVHYTLALVLGYAYPFLLLSLGAYALTRIL